MSDTWIEVEKHIKYLIEHVVCPQITSNAVEKMRVALLFNSKEVHNEGRSEREATALKTLRSGKTHL